jgi:hypothetical protein
VERLEGLGAELGLLLQDLQGGCLGGGGRLGHHVKDVGVIDDPGAWVSLHAELLPLKV